MLTYRSLCAQVKKIDILLSILRSHITTLFVYTSSVIVVSPSFGHGLNMHADQAHLHSDDDKSSTKKSLNQNISFILITILDCSTCNLTNHKLCNHLKQKKTTRRALTPYYSDSVRDMRPVALYSSWNLQDFSTHQGCTLNKTCSPIVMESIRLENSGLIFIKECT